MIRSVQSHYQRLYCPKHKNCIKASLWKYWPSFCCVFFQWHALTREEQAKYYELARKERQLHMQLYPTWSARDNYVRTCSSYSSLPCVHEPIQSEKKNKPIWLISWAVWKQKQGYAKALPLLQWTSFSIVTGLPQFTENSDFLWRALKMHWKLCWITHKKENWKKKNVPTP